MILKPSYPSALARKKVYLAAGVAAAFECKITLRPEDIKKVFQNSVTIRNMLTQRSGTPYSELTSPLVYGLLAHSHSWSDPNRAIQNIDRLFDKWDSSLISRPFEMPDVFCVANLATWTSNKIMARQPESSVDLGTLWTSYQLGRANGLNYSPVGRFVADLMNRLAKEDHLLREIALYFRSVAGVLGGSSGMARTWSKEVLSTEAMRNLELQGFSKEPWDDWSNQFPA